MNPWMRALVPFAWSLAGSLATVAAPATPQPGLWWNPAEGGRGYAIDAQGELVVLTMFGYDDSGAMQWYYADGPLQLGGSRWSGTLLMLDNGQPLNGGYRPAAIVGNAGVVTIDFSSKVTGLLTLPGGRQTAIQRQDFGVGSPPQALLGQWLLAYSIGTSSFGDRYNFTAISTSTSTGNGVVVDGVRRAGFEYQVSGSFAGRVVGFRFSSTGTVLDQYLWQLMLEEGRGSWVSPTTYNEYGMNVYKTHTPAGTAKAQEDTARDLDAKGGPRVARGVTIEELTQANAAMGELARQMWERVR